MSWKTIIIHLVVECQMETLRMLRLKLSVREYRLHVLFSLHEVWNYQSESIESERTVYTRAHTYKSHTKNSHVSILIPQLYHHPGKDSALSETNGTCSKVLPIRLKWSATESRTRGWSTTLSRTTSVTTILAKIRHCLKQRAPLEIGSWGMVR